MQRIQLIKGGVVYCTVTKAHGKTADGLQEVIGDTMAECTEQWPVLKEWSVAVISKADASWGKVVFSGLTWRETRTIYLWSKRDEEAVGDTLRHEIAHAVSVDGHGKRWQESARLLGVDPWYRKTLRRALLKELERRERKLAAARRSDRSSSPLQ